MKKNFVLIGTILICLIGFSGCTQKNTITIDGYTADWQHIPVYIQDATGDIKNEKLGKNQSDKEIFEFDVTTIKLAMNTSNLFILVQLADDTGYYFAHNREYARNIGELYFDIDNNTNTGGKAFASEIGGFDSKINIYTGVWNTETGYGVSGRMNLNNITKDSPLQYFFEYCPYLYNESNQEFSANNSKIIQSYKKPNLIAYHGNFIELQVPLEDLALRNDTNQTIRVLFSERGSGIGPESFSEETKTIPIIKE